MLAISWTLILAERGEVLERRADSTAEGRAPPLAVIDEAAHRHRQAPRIERLGEMHGVAGGSGALRVRLHRVRGEGESGDSAALATSDLAHELKAVQAGHAEIAH